MLKSGLLLSASNTGIALLSLARNILIARLISVEDFGIASTFAITMALVEMTSNIALDRLLVQARDGNTPALQRTAQLLQAGRGILGAAVLYFAAGPLAAVFGVPQAAWAYQLLALIPLLRGFAHLDMFRLQRDMRFAPSIFVELGGQGLATAAAVPLAIWLGDYRAMLFVLLLQQAIFTGASHIVAQRPYRWGWQPQLARRAVEFGWPLLLNGILLLAIFQGDRIIVGNLLGMANLAWFSAAFALTLMPSQVIAKTLQTFFLPQLSGLQHDRERFETLSLVTIQAGWLAGVALVAIFVLVGPTVLILFYGDRYEPAVGLLVWLAIMQGVRLAKAGPAIVATSRGHTKNPMYANIPRILVLPMAWLAIDQGGSIGTLIGLGIAGEMLSLLTTMMLLRWKLSLTFPGLVFWATACSAALGLAGVATYLSPPQAFYLRYEQFLLVLALPIVVWSMSALHTWSVMLVRGR